jgi:hypothetical protein
LFQFCVESLQLTEHQAYQYITVSRKCTEIPELMVALEDRRITVSKVRKMSSVISAENQSEWLALAERSSQKDLERAVRAKDPLPPVRDHFQITSADEVKLQACLKHEVSEKLQKVIGLLVEKRGGKVSVNEALDEACELYLEKFDPIKKAERAVVKMRQKCSHKLGENRVRHADKECPRSSKNHGRGGCENVPTSGVDNNAQGSRGSERDSTSQSNKRGTKMRPARSPLSAKTKHQVWLRDQGRCRYHRQGLRCDRTRFLHIHHRKPRALGGSDRLENLVLLCGEHHRAVHEGADRR